MDALARPAGAEGIGHLQQPVPRQGCAVRRPAWAAASSPASGNAVDAAQAIEPRFESAQRLLQRLLEGAADSHHLAHGFHLRGELGIGSRKLLEGEPAGSS